MIPFLLKRRAVATLVLAAATALLLARAVSLRADTDVGSLLPDTGEDLRDLEAFRSRFPSDDVVVLAVGSERLFTAEGLALLEDLTRRAESIPEAARVLSPVNARDLDGDDLGPFTSVPFEQARSGAMAPEELGRRLAAHPLFGGLLVGAGARAAAVLIEPRGRGAGDRARVVGRARELAASLPAGFEGHVAGLPVETVDVAASASRDQRLFAPLVCAVLAATLALLYRRAIGVAIPMAVVGLSLIWTLGVYEMAGRRLNPVTALMTPVVLVVSVEGAIHLLGHYLAARGAGVPRPAALQRAYERSLGPCFNASLTTAIGLASLVLLPVPAVRDFGVFTAAGTMIAYGLTMVAAPLLAAWLPDPDPRPAAGGPGRVEALLRGVAALARRRPVLVAAASAGVLLAALAGVSRIRVETDLVGALRSSSPLYRATRFIDERLTGVNALEILLPGAAAEDPAFLGRALRLEERVRALVGVRNVTGLPDLYARANRAFHGGDDAHERLPDGPEAALDLRDFRDLLQEKAAPELARFLSSDGSVLRLAARVDALDTGASQALFASIRAAAREAGIPEVTLTGEFAALSNMSTSLVYSQQRGLLTALVLIVAAMMVQFRSVSLGLLGAIPSGAAVLLVYGVMGWAGIPLSVPTAMIAAIAVGMTVDGTIHLVARFRQERRVMDDPARALDAALNASGRSVVFSAATLALGFWVGVFSSFTPSVHFAVLAGAALLLGLACEAVLLPLLLAPPRRPGGRRVAGERPPGGAIAVFALTAAAALWPASPAAAAAAEPVLKDQFGRRDGPALHRGETVLLLHARGTGLRRMKQWELSVLERAAPAPAVLRALDARAVRGKRTETEVGDRLRRDVPAEVAILIDWNGDLAARYALPDAEVSVTVLDATGAACGTESGPIRDGARDRILALLSEAARRGRCP